MAFHYTRAPDDGGVADAQGSPPGVPLATVLAGGLPPERVALELTAALCEVLYIAVEDGHAHGDLGVDHLWLTGDGVLCVGGFGEDRETTRAPERRPRGAGSDRYGLGRVGVRLLVPHADEVLDGLPMDGARPHDEAVADLVGTADLGAIPESIATDVRWFLQFLLAFDRAERPDALRVWRSFIAFARSVDGPTLAAWAADALRGQAPRRRVRPRDTSQERLGSAQATAGPLGSGMSFGGGAAAGGRTMFWTRDDLASIAEAGPPEVGGGRKTGHWSREELLSMATGSSEAPRPHREPAGDAGPVDPVGPVDPDDHPEPGPPAAPAGPLPPAVAPPAAARPSPVAAPVPAPPAVPTARVHAPWSPDRPAAVATARPAPDDGSADDAAAARRRQLWILVGVGVGAFVVALVILAGLAVVLLATTGAG